MREYQSRTAHGLVACTCDRCKRRMTPKDDGEWEKRLAFNNACGFYSVFGDGDVVSLDLCQHCVREVLGPWLCIKRPAEAAGLGMLTTQKGVIRKPAKPVSVEDMNNAGPEKPRKRP